MQRESMEFEVVVVGAGRSLKQRPLSAAYGLHTSIGAISPTSSCLRIWQW